MSMIINFADHHRGEPKGQPPEVDPSPISEKDKFTLTSMMYEAIALVAKRPKSEQELELLNRKQELQIRNREKL